MSSIPPNPNPYSNARRRVGLAGRIRRRVQRWLRAGYEPLESRHLFAADLAADLAADQAADQAAVEIDPLQLLEGNELPAEYGCSSLSLDESAGADFEQPNRLSDDQPMLSDCSTPELIVDSTVLPGGDLSLEWNSEVDHWWAEQGRTEGGNFTSTTDDWELTNHTLTDSSFPANVLAPGGSSSESPPSLTPDTPETPTGADRSKSASVGTTAGTGPLEAGPLEKSPLDTSPPSPPPNRILFGSPISSTTGLLSSAPATSLLTNARDTMSDRSLLDPAQGDRVAASESKRFFTPRAGVSAAGWTVHAEMAVQSGLRLRVLGTGEQTNSSWEVVPVRATVPERSRTGSVRLASRGGATNTAMTDSTGRRGGRAVSLRSRFEQTDLRADLVPTSTHNSAAILAIMTSSANSVADGSAADPAPTPAVEHAVVFAEMGNAAEVPRTASQADRSSGEEPEIRGAVWLSLLSLGGSPWLVRRRRVRGSNPSVRSATAIVK